MYKQIGIHKYIRYNTFVWFVVVRCSIVLFKMLALTDATTLYQPMKFSPFVDYYTYLHSVSFKNFKSEYLFQIIGTPVRPSI